MFLCPSTLDLIPKVGDFYFFPNYLIPPVPPPPASHQDRTPPSPPANIDDEIYNVPLKGKTKQRPTRKSNSTAGVPLTGWKEMVV
jgi:hypothetical protein